MGAFFFIRFSALNKVFTFGPIFMRAQWVGGKAQSV